MALQEQLAQRLRVTLDKITAARARLITLIKVRAQKSDYYKVVFTWKSYVPWWRCSRTKLSPPQEFSTTVILSIKFIRSTVLVLMSCLEPLRGSRAHVGGRINISYPNSVLFPSHADLFIYFFYNAIRQQLLSMFLDHGQKSRYHTHLYTSCLKLN